MRTWFRKAVITAAIIHCSLFIIHSANAADRHWLGTNSVSAASALNWAENAVPANGDVIILDAGSESHPMTWDIDDVIPASWTQTADYTGTVTFETGATGATAKGTAQTVHGVLSADGSMRVLKVAGNVTVNGGTWTHKQTPSMNSSDPGWISGQGVWRVIADIGGDFTLGADATIDVVGKGFQGTQGPGKPADNNNGASHGGEGMRIGGYYNGSQGGMGSYCYGSIKKPVTIGSGYDTRWGGGGIQIEVAGASTVAGTMVANSKDGGSGAWSAGSGGGIYMKTGSLNLPGTISAKGGDAGNCSPGGGGRIAIVLTGDNADFSNTARANITAKSGLSSGFGQIGSYGTIYFEKKSDNGRGELLVRGMNNKLTEYGIGTEIGVKTDSSDNDFSLVTLEGAASLLVLPGATLKTDSIVVSDATKSRIYLAGGMLDYTASELNASYLEINASIKVPEITGWAYYDSTVRVANATGTINLPSTSSVVVDGKLTVLGDLIVGNGCTVKQTAYDTMKSTYKFTAPTNYLQLVVNGDMTVAEGGTVSAIACGLPSNTGTGRPQNGIYRGGGYGGEGGHYTLENFVTEERTHCYGSIREPFDYGSGGGGYNAGGGIMKLIVNGDLTVNGSISARGGQGTGSNEQGARGGSGGSVQIFANTLAGTGSIDANGGKTVHYSFGAGGGGRVAVTLTDPLATFDAFYATGGTVIARGGASKNSAKGFHAGAGTVYTRTGAQGPLEGTLIIANGDSTAQYGRTVISAEVLQKEVGSVIVTNNAVLMVDEGEKLTAYGDWKVAKGSSAILNAHSTIEFAGAADAVISGTNQFYNFICTTPGKTLKFDTVESKCIIQPNGAFTITGEADDEVKLRSVSNGVQWAMHMDNDASASVSFADVQDSNNDGLTISATDSKGADANNIGWSIIGGIVVGDNVWLGTSGANWDAPANWSQMRTPVYGDKVIIPLLSSGDYPVLATSYTGDKVIVDTGATLTVNGALVVSNEFSVAGSLTGSGVITLEDAVADFEGAAIAFPGTFEVNGNKNIELDFADDTLGTIIFTRTGGAVSLVNGVAADVFTYNGSGALQFGTGKVLSASEVRIDGLVSDIPSLAISGADSSTWYLDASRIVRVNGVTVGGSNARLLPVVATASSASGAVNVNWTFTGTQCTWSGAAENGDWSDSGNWENGTVPSAGDVAIVPGGAVTATNRAAFYSLFLEGGSVTFAKGFEADGAIEVSSGTAITVDQPSAAGGSLTLRSGAMLTHSANTAANLNAGNTNRIDIAVGGDMTIETGAKIDVTGKGFPKNGNTAGGSYGGTGADANAHSVVQPCHGSIRCPYDLGGAGQSPGGGAVKLTVTGDLILNGDIIAEGAFANSSITYYGHYTGSGGSCWITCATLRGTGIANVNGGRQTGSFGGGGGRFALWQTVAENTDAFTGKVTAFGAMYDSGIGTEGSLPYGSCGTVFYHNAGDEADGGLLVLDNKNGYSHEDDSYYPSLPSKTDFPGKDSPADFKSADIVISRRAALNLTTNVTVRDVLMTSTANSRKSTIRLNGYRLTISSNAHRHTDDPDSNMGRGWSGQVVGGNPETGSIVYWIPAGTKLIVK